MITNFLRYPGGKRRMLAFLRQSLPTATTLQGRYIEPFVGGGSVFFSIAPNRALLSDINPDLIDLYRGVRQYPEAVWHSYCDFGSNKAAYQQVRDTDRPSRLVDRAARVLFLNRTCFKGMWRHNRQGKFNVGYGGQDRRWVISLDNLVTVARALRKAELRCSDFEKVVEGCEEGDFIFADPPYLPGGKELINDHYTWGRFSFQDHHRLAATLQAAKERGAHWALTTSAHPDIVSLFAGNEVIRIPRGTGRRPGATVTDSGEVLITSYCRKGEQAP